MREILFRGKRIDNGEWAEGLLIQDNRLWYIVEHYGVCPVGYFYLKSGGATVGFYVEIDPSTVCQSSSIIDKDGIEIFADDLRKDVLGRIFRIYQIEGGFVIKAQSWITDILDLKESDSLVLIPLTGDQTKDWLKNTTTHMGNIHDKIK